LAKGLSKRKKEGWRRIFINCNGEVRIWWCVVCSSISCFRPLGAGLEAPFHMMPSKDYFISFVRWEESIILMENDANHRAMGEGIVWIRMFDRVIRTLTDVQYVPGLWKSLISLGQLASLGCKVTIEKDSLKVSRGALVFMKGDGFRNLYLLKGVEYNSRWFLFDNNKHIYYIIKCVWLLYYHIHTE